MKRWISSLMLAGVATIVMAQAPFTIVRPADGSKVREKVRVLIPKNSIPPGGYVGVFLDGKLIEATVPPLEGKYYVYTLDTKGRGIKDSEGGKPAKLELVLYTDFNDQARIVDRSSVDLFVSNKANIAVPNKGLTLRYRFVPGTEMIYNMEQRVTLSSISEQQQKNGGRAAQQDVDTEKIRMLYAVDNAYGDGSGLLRMQALPIKGKDYADLTAGDDLTAKRYYTSQMAPLYMRVTSAGHEVFAALPPYIPLDGAASNIDPLNLYAAFPLPTLPIKAVRPGDSWQSRFQEGSLDLTKYPNIESVVTKIPARGEFVGTEWERGHPCAMIRNSIESASLKNKATQANNLMGGTNQIEDDKISVTETIWFALDTRKVIKIVRDVTIDRKGQMSGGSFPGAGGGPSMGPGAGMSPGAGMGPGGRGGDLDDRSLVGVTSRQGFAPPGAAGGQGPGRRGGPQGPGGGFGPPTGFGPGGPQGGRGGAPTGGAGAGATFVRVRILQTFTLEK